MKVVLGLFVAAALWAQAPVPSPINGAPVSGSSAPTTGTNVVVVSNGSGGTATPSTNPTISPTGTMTLNGASGNSDFMFLHGATSGGLGFVAPTMAGTNSEYILPTPASATLGYAITYNGSATCPTSVSDNPASANCYALTFAPASGSSGALTQLATQTLASASSTINLSSLSQSYNHLQVWLLCTAMTGTGAINHWAKLGFNADSSSTMVASGTFVQNSTANAS